MFVSKATKYFLGFGSIAIVIGGIMLSVAVVSSYHRPVSIMTAICGGAGGSALWGLAAQAENSAKRQRSETTPKS